jgi:hypothetical protein
MRRRLDAAVPSRAGWRLDDGTGLLEIPGARGTIPVA